MQTWLGHASAELTWNLYCRHPGTGRRPGWDRQGQRTFGDAVLERCLGTLSWDAVLGDATGTRTPISSKRNTLAAMETGSDLGGCGEPEKGIEPLTYALREGSPSSQNVPDGR